MRCQHCKKQLKEGQVVLPLFKMYKFARFDDPMPANVEDGYIHITCIERSRYDD